MPTPLELLEAYKIGGNLSTDQITGREKLPVIVQNSPTTSSKSPVPIISTSQAIPVLNEATTAQANDVVNLEASKKASDTAKETQKKKWDADVKKQGGLTGEEIASIGGDVNNYDFESNSGLYLPKSNYNSLTNNTDEQDINNAFDIAQSIYIDAPTEAYITSIKNMYAGLIQEAKDLNVRSEAGVATMGIRSGTSRYASGVAQGILSSEMRAGLARITDITNSMASQIAQAENLRSQKSYDLFVQKRQEIKVLKDAQLKELQKQQELVKKKQEEIQTKKIQSSRDGAVSGLLQQGVTDPNELLNYLNYDEQGNQIGDFTADEINKTLTNLTGSSVDLGSDGNMFKFALKQGWLPEGSTIFDYWKSEAMAKKSPSSEKVGMGAGGDVGFDQFAKESIAFSVLPPTLRNSDAEKAYYLQGIRSGLSQGKTPYEIADVLMGYNITEPSAFSEGLRRYLSIAGTDKNVAPEIARLVNAKQYDKAISIIENAVYVKAKTNLGEKFISESEVEFLFTKANEIQKTLDSYGFFDAIGPFSGTLNDAFGKLGRKKGAELKAKITYLTQEIQKRQAGSAMTESEWARILEPIVPQLTDKRGIFEMKIKEGKNTPLQKLNAERSQYELPTINEAELFDRKLRIPYYSSQIAFDPLDVGGDGTNNNNPLGI